MNSALPQYIVQFNDVSLAVSDGHSLDHINLKVREGELVYLKGPFASADQLILQSIYGWVKPRSGTAKVFNINLNECGEEQIADIRKNIGLLLVKQSMLFDHLTVSENIDLVQAFISGANNFNSRIIEDQLSQNNISPKIKVSALDDTVKIKLRLAISLATNPKLYLLQNALDPLQNELSNQLMSMLVNQVRQTGMTLIITTAIESILQQFPGRIISAYHAEYAESIN